MTMIHALTVNVARDLGWGRVPKKITMSERAYQQLSTELRHREKNSERLDIRHLIFQPRVIRFDVPGYGVRPEVEVAFSRMLLDDQFTMEYETGSGIITEEKDPEAWRYENGVQDAQRTE